MQRIRNLLCTITAVICLLFVGSCDEEENGVGPTALKTSFRVIHTGYDSPSFDINVDGATVISRLEYGASSGYTQVNSGTKNLKFMPAGASGPILIDSDFILHDNLQYSIVAVNELDSIEAIFAQDITTPVSGKAKVRLINASAQSPQLDIELAGSPGNHVFSSVAFKGITDYVELESATYTASISLGGDRPALLYFDAFAFRAGVVYTIALYGTLDKSDIWPLGMRVFLDNGHGSAYIDMTVAQTKLRLINASYDASLLDAAVDGVTTLSGVDYGQSSGYVAVGIGARRMTVTPSGLTSPVYIDTYLNLGSLEEFTLFAMDEKSMMEASVSFDARAPVADKAKIRFVHGVPDIPALDIRENNVLGAAVFTDIVFKGVSEYIELDGGTYTFVSLPTGSGTELYVIGPFDIENGMVYTILAHGTADTTDSYALGIRAFVDNGLGDTYSDIPVTPSFARLRLIQADYDSPAINIEFGSDTVIDNTAYGMSSGYMLFNAGSRPYDFYRVGETQPFVRALARLFERDGDYSLFTFNEIPVPTSPVLVKDSIPDETGTWFRFVNASLDAPAFDLKLDSGAGTTLFADVDFKDVTSYIEGSEEAYNFVITAAGSTEELFLFEPFGIASGQVITFVALGTIDTADAYPFILRAFSDRGEGELHIDLLEKPNLSNVRFIHTSYDAPSVDVRVDAAVQVSGLNYKSSSGYKQVKAGMRNIQFTLAGESSPIIIDTSYAFVRERDYSVFTVNSLSLINAIIIEDARTPDPAKALIRLAHTSPDAPAIDIRLDMGTGTSVFTDQAFGDVTSNLELDGGSYAFVVTPTGSTEELAAFEPIPLQNGEVYTMVVYGTLDSLDAYPLGVRIFIDSDPGSNFIDLTPAPRLANLRFIHTSYDAPDIDINMDGGSLVSGLIYGYSSGYGQIDIGDRNIQMTPAGFPGLILVDTNLTFERARDYTVFTVGEFSVINVISELDPRIIDAGKVWIRFVQASPDAPVMDVKLDNGFGQNLFVNAAFKNVTTYMQLDAGDFTFVITEAGLTTPLFTYAPVSLESGKIYSMVAHGTANPLDAYPFSIRVFIDDDAGDTFIDLTEIILLSGR